MSTLISSLLPEGRLALEQCGFELHGFIYMQIFLLVNSICAVLRHSAVSRLFATPWTVACQAPLSRQEYWRGLPFPPPGDLPSPGIVPVPPVSPAWAGRFLPLHYLGSPVNTVILYSWKLVASLDTELQIWEVDYKLSINYLWVFSCKESWHPYPLHPPLFRGQVC